MRVSRGMWLGLVIGMLLACLLLITSLWYANCYFTPIEQRLYPVQRAWVDRDRTCYQVTLLPNNVTFTHTVSNEYCFAVDGHVTQVDEPVYLTSACCSRTPIAMDALSDRLSLWGWMSVLFLAIFVVFVYFYFGMWESGLIYDQSSIYHC